MIYDIKNLVVLHLDAGSDVNGNPRRLFLLVHPNVGFLSAVDEGYLGTEAIGDFDVDFSGDKKEIVRQLQKVITPKIDTTFKYYRELLKHYSNMHIGDKIAITTNLINQPF